ncbi:hypothetical protein CSUB01_08660 [Colletotrichum sublineola]|uniref:Uncharacterized protein n=1 Tax=Colletotrichum sublineola TaxID=1173701 RepID=A0A066XPY7_COLSU|nr:hypothetical protein CSUB01_08660 [Colletotrichum sublineola]
MDNANVAKPAQVGAADANLADGLVHGQLNNIQSPDNKMPVSVMGMNSSLSGALASTQIKADTFWPTHTATGTFTNMSVQTSRTQASSPATTTMNILDYADQLELWFVRCVLPPVHRRPLQCVTMKPSPITDSLSILELTTLGTDISTTLTGQEATPTEPWMELTTIHSLITPAPTPTGEGVIVVTVTSTVIQTEDPEIEYTYAKVDSASPMTLRG